VCCDCVVLLYVGMGYHILRGLFVVTEVCSCASVWVTVHGGLCIVSVVCCCASVWCTVCWGVCVFLI